MSATKHDPATIPGFRASRLGLFLPADTPNARAIYKLTPEQEKKLRHAILEVFGPAHLAFMLKCDWPHCPDPRVERINQPDGGYLLRCGCMERVFSKGSQVSTRPRR